MNWLVTIAHRADVDEVKELLLGWGCELNDAVIPLDELQVLEVDGPPDLPERAKDDERIVEVHPNSTMSYY